MKGPTATRPAEGKCGHAEGVQAIIASCAFMGLPLGDLAKELPSIIALLVPLGDNTVAGGRAASVNDALQALGERLERAPLVVELVEGRGGDHPSDRVTQWNANVEGPHSRQGGERAEDRSVGQ